MIANLFFAIPPDPQHRIREIRPGNSLSHLTTAHFLLNIDWRARRNMGIDQARFGVTIVSSRPSVKPFGSSSALWSPIP